MQQQTAGIINVFFMYSWLSDSVINGVLEDDVRHDWSLCDEGLRRGVMFDTLHCYSLASVLSNHHIWEPQHSGLTTAGKNQKSVHHHVKKRISPPNSPFPIDWRSFSSFLDRAQPPAGKNGSWNQMLKCLLTSSKME